MAIRIPNNPSVGVSEIRALDSGKLYYFARVYKSEQNGDIKVVWEQTTLTDCDGKAFYDKDGIPFQGKH